MSETHAISLKRSTALLAALTFMAMLTVVNLASFFGTASAATLSSRSLTLTSTLPGDSAVGAANSETNGADATHTFTFTPGTAASIGSFTFEWCTTALGACTAPDGLVVNDGTAITVQTVDPDGAGASPATTFGNTYSIDGDASDTNLLVVEAGTANALDTDDIVVFSFDDITNPTDTGEFFVRINSYTGTSSQTGPTDDGGVASAITEGIVITSRVAETLGFSTTGEIDTTNVMDPTSACLPLTGSGAITLGDPANENTLALDSTFDNYSAFRVYTNAASGVAIQYEGDTLRRGTLTTDPTIDPIGGTPAVSAEGTEQFGLAVDTVSGGTNNVSITSSSSTLDMTYVSDAAALAAGGALTIDGAYDGGSGVIQDVAPDAEFAFETNNDPALRTPVTIATSTGYVDCKTVAVRYIANISPLTTSGTYTTTIVYSAVPTY